MIFIIVVFSKLISTLMRIHSLYTQYWFISSVQSYSPNASIMTTGIYQLTLYLNLINNNQSYLEFYIICISHSEVLIWLQKLFIGFLLLLFLVSLFGSHVYVPNHWDIMIFGGWCKAFWFFSFTVEHASVCCVCIIMFIP